MVPRTCCAFRIHRHRPGNSRGSGYGCRPGAIHDILAAAELVARLSREYAARIELAGKFWAGGLTLLSRCCTV